MICHDFEFISNQPSLVFNKFYIYMPQLVNTKQVMTKWHVVYRLCVQAGTKIARSLHGSRSRHTWLLQRVGVCIRKRNREIDRKFRSIHVGYGQLEKEESVWPMSGFPVPHAHTITPIHIWPASCEKGPSDICKKCRPRPAAASPTPRLVRVCTFWQS